MNPLTTLLAFIVTVLCAAVPAQAQFSLLHAFGGSPNDGATPWWGSSLVVTGTTLFGMTANGGVSTNGVVFKVSTNGTGYQVIHQFDGYVNFLNANGSKDDGAIPYGTPLLDAGVLYGMTAQGGSNGFGTVWRMTTDGNAFQVLHHFGGTLDGHQPVGSLVKDGSTLYGLTSSGGSNSAIGVLFKLDTSGAGYQILRHFGVADSGLVTPYGSPLLAGGRLFGTTRLGGSGGGGIWAIDVDGQNYQVLHTFTGTTTDGWQPNGSLIIDGTTLYGMAQQGGANNAGIIYQIQTNGSGFQIMHHFALTEAYFPQGDLIRDGTTLYGFTQSGVTNIFSTNLGGGSIIQINTDGSNYKQLYTFLFPVRDPDGQWPYGTPLKIGTKLFGMTQLGGTLLGNNQGTVFAFDLTGNGGGGGGGGGGGSEEAEHDLVVVGIKAPKKVTLQEGKPPKPGKLAIAIQNAGDFTETINNATALQNLLNLQITSRGACGAPVATLVPPKSGFPVVLAPNKKLTVAYTVAIDCANDPLATSKTADHSDYEYSVMLDLNALSGQTDAHPANDDCPRPASGADKGCGNKDPITKQIGADVLTDVIAK